ncbi:MAG TPA: 3-oxoadipate--succinyl-CoA transferase subunit A, partial [Pseudomonas sp.]|nr:3-oxoadipate--succinyl-CoA transferase subunit A [Pseudomonas sp.]
MSIIGLWPGSWTVTVFTTQSAYRKQHEIRLMAE